MLLYVIVLVCSLCCYAECSNIITYTGCQNTTLVVNCSSAINVTDAFYGRMDKTICPEGQPPAALNTNSCSSNKKYAMNFVKNKCNTKTRCTIWVGDTQFGGDPCPGIYKYAYVTFDCPVPSTTSTTTSTRKPTTTTTKTTTTTLKPTTSTTRSTTSSTTITTTEPYDTPTPHELVTELADLRTAASLKVWLVGILFGVAVAI